MNSSGWSLFYPEDNEIISVKVGKDFSIGCSLHEEIE